MIYDPGLTLYGGIGIPGMCIVNAIIETPNWEQEGFDRANEVRGQRVWAQIERLGRVEAAARKLVMCLPTKDQVKANIPMYIFNELRDALDEPC